MDVGEAYSFVLRYPLEALLLDAILHIENCTSCEM